MYKEQYGEYALWLKGFKGLPAQRNVNRWEVCKVSSNSLLVPDSPGKPLPNLYQIFLREEERRFRQRYYRWPGQLALFQVSNLLTDEKTSVPWR